MDSIDKKIKRFEKGFKQVVIIEKPVETYYSIASLSERFVIGPERIMDFSVDGTIQKIYTFVIFETFEKVEKDAVDKLFIKMNKYKKDKKGDNLVWREKPEFGYFVDPLTGNKYYTGFSRLAIAEMY